MIYEIFSAIETRLKAHANLSTYEFFRFDTQSNSNQQSNASVPFLKLVFVRQETIKDAQRWRLINKLYLDLEARWATTYLDVNAIERIQEQSLRDLYIKQAIFPGSGEEDFLNLAYVTNLIITSEPLDFAGLEIKKHNGISLRIEIEYIQSI